MTVGVNFSGRPEWGFCCRPFVYWQGAGGKDLSYCAVPGYADRVFILPDALRYRQRKNYRTTGTGSRPNANWAGSYHSKTGEKPYRHKCTVCGRTDTDYPNLEFRYCSKCNGYYCYCIDHINNHVHITTPPEGKQ